MDDFADQVQKISGKYKNEIKRACGSLIEYFNLNQFFYYKIGADASFYLLDTRVEWSEYCADMKLHLVDPFFRHPDFFRSGITLWKDVQDKDLKFVLDPAKNKFQLNLILQILEKSQGGLEVFGFSSSSSDETQIAFLLNDLPLLKRFIKTFRENNQLLISRLKDSQIDLGRLVGPAFHENRSRADASSETRKRLLNELNIDERVSLTRREKEVIYLIKEGYSSGKVAPLLYLSKRTVEHHIERIKDKLKCFSKRELLQKIREIEGLGML